MAATTLQFTDKSIRFDLVTASGVHAGLISPYTLMVRHFDGSSVGFLTQALLINNMPLTKLHTIIPEHLASWKCDMESEKKTVLSSDNTSITMLKGWTKDRCATVSVPG